MDKIIIEGGQPLTGAVPISGAKNAVLPLMIAGLLTDQPLTITGAPTLADTHTLTRVLESLGAEVTRTGDEISVHTPELRSIEASYEWVSKMRASFWVIGPLLARGHKARVSLPGGCAIGTRPVDIYLQALAAMGAEIDIEAGYVIAAAPNGLQPAKIDFPLPSVGATHVVMMAACLISGTTIITNAAREPEIVDLGECLIKMGAQIAGLGTSEIVITGNTKLTGASHKLIRDRIEAGAYAMAFAATGSEGVLQDISLPELGALVPALIETGAKLEAHADGVMVKAPEQILPTNITTAPYPGFATDLQAPMMALLSLADGVSHIQETLFENRFMHVQELVRLGAQISLDGDTATIAGQAALIGAPVMATDLRASVCLVIAGLMAQGQTVISRVYHLDRGFENLEQKLAACGATIWREQT